MNDIILESTSQELSTNMYSQSNINKIDNSFSTYCEQAIDYELSYGCPTNISVVVDRVSNLKIKVCKTTLLQYFYKGPP